MTSDKVSSRENEYFRRYHITDRLKHEKVTHYLYFGDGGKQTHCFKVNSGRFEIPEISDGISPHFYIVFRLSFEFCAKLNDWKDGNLHCPTERLKSIAIHQRSR